MKKTERRQMGRKWIIIVLLVVITVILIGIFNKPSSVEEMPWEKKGSKQPQEYTWDEFQKLEGIQKDYFFESFGSAEAFEAWMNTAGGPVQQRQQVEEVLWEQDGKQPDDYSWEEYQELEGEHKDLFFESFESPDDFDAWMESVNPKQETVLEHEIWAEKGKTPDEYTWEEFTALEPEKQEAFFESFETPEEFEAWMKEVKPVLPDEKEEKSQKPWETGDKYPSQYTWKEFLALSPELQEEFFLSFSSPERFEAWMNSVKPDE